MATATFNPTADGSIVGSDPGTAYGSGDLVISLAPVDDDVRGGITADLSSLVGKNLTGLALAMRRVDQSGSGTMEYRRKSPAYAETDTFTSASGHETTPTASAAFPAGTDASGTRTTVINNTDFRDLGRDAIQNRSGILSFFMQYAAGTSSGVYAICADREDATANNRPLLTATYFDLPVVGIAGTALNYTEGSGAQAVDPSATITADAGVAQITTATIAITDGFGNKGATDVLAMTASISGITPSYDSGTGILTLTVTAGVAAYQAALRAVTFETNAAAGDAAREITITVTDIQGGVSVAVTRDIDIVEAQEGISGATKLLLLLD